MKKFSKVILSSTILATLLLTSCGSDSASATDSGDSSSEGSSESEASDSGSESAEAGHVTGDLLVKNANARKAIACGYDENYIVEDILADGSLPANYFVPVDFLQNPEGGDYRDGLSDYQVYDAEKAKEYWAAAKEELGFETAELVLLNYDDENGKKIGEFLKSELEQNLEGISVSIETVPYQQKLERSRAGDFEIEFTRWGPDYLDAATFLDMWLIGNEYNRGNYVSEEYDSLVAGTYDNTEDRYNAFVEAEKILLEDDAAIAPVYQSNRVFLDSQQMSGIVSHSFGADFSYQWVELDREDKVLNLLESMKAPSLDNTLATDAVSFDILNAIGEGLVSLGQQGSDVIPAIAESWDVSDDGLTYTFHLRDDATFVNHLGEVVGNVTAQSFVDSWERLEDPDNNASYAFLVRDVGNIDTYTAVDDLTLEVTVTKDTPWFLSLMSFGSFQPIHKESLEAFGESYGTTLETVISTGPFYLSSWNFSERVIATKNPHYFGADDVKIDGINYRIIEGVENDTALGMYFAGEIDRVALSGENVETYKEHEDATLLKEARIYYLMFNIDEE
ncbi:MAG: ABC transporter substrate-binding protein [Lachnospirales bacterium]